jgi:hypothetical protein
VIRDTEKVDFVLPSLSVPFSPVDDSETASAENTISAKVVARYLQLAERRVADHHILHFKFEIKNEIFN